MLRAQSRGGPGGWLGSTGVGDGQAEGKGRRRQKRQRSKRRRGQRHERRLTTRRRDAGFEQKVEQAAAGCREESHRRKMTPAPSRPHNDCGRVPFAGLKRCRPLGPAASFSSPDGSQPLPRMTLCPPRVHTTLTWNAAVHPHCAVNKQATPSAHSTKTEMYLCLLMLWGAYHGKVQGLASRRASCTPGACRCC
jgi:hypothetical protein